MWIYGLVFIITMLVSMAYTMYIKYANAGDENRATLSDMLLVTLGLTVYQIWADKGNDVRVFIAEIFGSGAGTYITVRYFKKDKKENK